LELWSSGNLLPAVTEEKKSHFNCPSLGFETGTSQYKSRMLIYSDLHDAKYQKLSDPLSRWSAQVVWIFKISVRTSKKTQTVSMRTVSWLLLSGEIIAVYFENHTKSVYTRCGQNAELLNVKVLFHVVTEL
jgi:uracil DNA glycosylase